MEARKQMRNEGRVWLLSPFDPLVIQRKKLKQFFNFEYTLECYVPEKKRKYGYYVLPILIDDVFVGRIDLKANRQKKKLEIKSWHWENGSSFRKSFKAQVENELDLYEKFSCA